MSDITSLRDRLAEIPAPNTGFYALTEWQRYDLISGLLDKLHAIDADKADAIKGFYGDVVPDDPNDWNDMRDELNEVLAEHGQ